MQLALGVYGGLAQRRQRGQQAVRHRPGGVQAAPAVDEDSSNEGLHDVAEHLGGRVLGQAKGVGGRHGMPGAAESLWSLARLCQRGRARTPTFVLF